MLFFLQFFCFPSWLHAIGVVYYNQDKEIRQWRIYQFGMAGKWNSDVKGWEVSKENFEREFANLAERWAD